MRLIVDGDIIAYAAAFVAPQDEDKAISRVNSMLDNVTHGCFLEHKDLDIYVKGKDNFRDEYDFYKAGRAPSEEKLEERAKRPDTLAVTHAYLAEMGYCADGGEADDYCLARAQELKDAGEDYIICSIDKDLKQMSGKHQNTHSGEITVISDEQAEFWLLQQCLTGDAADDIPGIRGIGPAKSKKYLEMFKPNERRAAILDKYREVWDEDEAVKRLTECWNCVYIRKDLNDLKILPLPDEFFNKGK